METLLDAALERDEGSRETFVRGATQDSAVAEEVLSLLGCVDSSSVFLEPPSQAPGDDPVLSVGERLGAWEVESLIGRGGMGEVYLVRRADGFYEQSAALKLMNSRSVEHEALFDSERQFLARLEHPGIARLLDGGVRSDGRPWMVMEFASGAPIDTWVRDKALGPREVVTLINSVCDALAHAHAKLIVHRDLKPSNILVDGSGRPRVIDFGVARLTGGDDDLSVPLSLDYAAPELLAGEAATTATDVYGLAATLYALLANRPPLMLSHDPLPVAVSRAWDEVPPPVSAEVCAGRDGALLKDLDAILARALSKQAKDRYPTIEAFRDDLERALTGRAVTPRLSERGYVAGRFVKRHRWQTAAAAAVVFSLAAGLSVSLWQARQAWAERESALREQARLEAVQQYLYFMLRDGADASGGTSASAREILEVAGQQVTTMFAADPARGGAVMHALAELYLYLGDYEAAAPLLRRVAEAPETEPSVRASARYDLAQYHLRTAEPGAAAVLLAQAQAFWEQDPDLWRRRLVDSRLVEARVLRDQGEIDDAIQLLGASLPERIRLSGANHRETGVYHNDLGVLFNAAGRRDEAAASFRAALEVWRETSLGDSPDALNTLNNLAAIEVLSGRPEEAAVLFSRAVEVRRSLYGPSAATAALLNNYGKTLLKLDRGEEALPYLREAVDMAREHAGVGSLHYASAIAGLSEALSVVGNPSAAVTTATDGYDAVRESVGPAHPATAVTAIALARVLAVSDRSRAAVLLDQAEATLAPMGPGVAAQLEAIDAIRTRHRL